MARLGFGSLLRYLHRAAPNGGDDDARLLQRFVGGRDECAFAVLVERHGRMVLGVCSRLLDNPDDAEDAFQATFLVLARKAASVRNRASLASWLYGVARRTSLRARAAATRHHPLPEGAELQSRSDPVAEAAWRELRPLLDAELDRLPEKYRAPLVLCYLEGLTNVEAARQLGWTKGTVSGRLARARDLLRGRLTRRGLTLAPTVLVTILAERGAAAVSATLSATTITAAATGASAAPAAALAEGVLHAMVVAKWKAVAAVALTLAVLGTGAGAVVSGGPSDAPAAARQEKAVNDIEKLRKENEELRRQLAAAKDELRRVQAVAEQQRLIALQERERAQAAQEEAEAARAAAERALRQAQERAAAAQALDRITTQQSLKQIGLALHHYHDTHKALPGAAILDKKDKPLLSWRVLILPYIEQQALYNEFKLDEPWDSAHNKKLIDKMPKLYSTGGKAGTTRFRVFVGKGTLFENPEGHTFADVPDGLSNTIAVVEAEAGVPWTKPDELPYDDKKPLPKLGAAPKDGFNALFGDGSVRFISPNFVERTLRWAILRNDGNAIDAKDLQK